MEILKKKEHCVTSGGFGLDCVYGNGWCHFFFLGTHIHLFQLHRTFQKEPHEDLRAPDMRMTQLLTRAWGRRAKGSLQASVDPSSCSTRSIYMADPIPNSIHHLVCNTQVCGWRLPHPHCSSTCIGCWVHLYSLHWQRSAGASCSNWWHSNLASKKTNQTKNQHEGEQLDSFLSNELSMWLVFPLRTISLWSCDHVILHLDSDGPLRSQAIWDPEPQGLLHSHVLCDYISTSLISIPAISIQLGKWHYALPHLLFTLFSSGRAKPEESVLHQYQQVMGLEQGLAPALSEQGFSQVSCTHVCRSFWQVLLII